MRPLAFGACGRRHLLLVAAVDEIHDHADDDGLLRRLADRDQQGHGDQGVVGDAPDAVRAAQQAVLLHEPEDEPGRDALVAVHEAVVLDQEVEQMGGLLSRLG